MSFSLIGLVSFKLKMCVVWVFFSYLKENLVLKKQIRNAKKGTEAEI